MLRRAPTAAHPPDGRAATPSLPTEPPNGKRRRLAAQLAARLAVPLALQDQVGNDAQLAEGNPDTRTGGEGSLFALGRPEGCRTLENKLLGQGSAPRCGLMGGLPGNTIVEEASGSDELRAK